MADKDCLSATLQSGNKLVVARRRLRWWMTRRCALADGEKDDNISGAGRGRPGGARYVDTCQLAPDVTRKFRWV